MAGCVARVMFCRTHDVIRLSRGYVWKLLVLLLAVLVYQFQVGYVGHTYQHFDFSQRTAFYGNLISYPWPVILPDGREMSYNLAFWLEVRAFPRLAVVREYCFSGSFCRLYGWDE